MGDPLSKFESLRHLAYHVFLPPQLPQSELNESAYRQVNLQITHSVIATVHKYQSQDHEPTHGLEWDCISRMLERFAHYIQVPLAEDRLSQDLRNMEGDDVLALFIRAQNAAVIIRKRSDTTIFEVFEAQAPSANVMSIPGKLVRYYPGPVVEVPNTIANDIDFIEEIASFLTQMDSEKLEEAAASTSKEVGDSTNPNYFVQLFFGILRGMGEVVEPPRVVKRVADEVLWDGGRKAWRRSPIWLIVRVAIQTTLSSNNLYKHFMAFYHADVLLECRQQKAFSSDLLFMMRVKMAKRVYKVKDSVPEFVVEMVKTVTEDIQEVLQKRWTKVQDDQARSPKWNPSRSEFKAATEQTLPNSRAYLEEVFQGRSDNRERSGFAPDPDSRLRNITDFTAYAGGALAKAFRDDKHITLFDFEASVFEYLSAWTDEQLSNASDACKTLSSCFDQYLTATRSYYTVDVADQSIMLLTLMKLWVAIDLLVIHQIPLLRDFSPEIPGDILDSLLLRTSQHIDQARVVQQYLHVRHDSALPINDSIFSDNASEFSFAVQYYCQSRDLHALKSEIEQYAHCQREEKIKELQGKNEEHGQLNRQASQLTHEFVKQYYNGRLRSDHSGSCERCAVERKRDNLRIGLHEWPLPSGNHEAEAVVFELQHPEAYTIWRDTTYRVLRDLGELDWPNQVSPRITLEHYPGLRSWHAAHVGTSARVSMSSSTSTLHDSKTQLPAQTSSVCVSNGLKYQLYDSLKRHWIEKSYKGVNFRQFGTLLLPKNSLYRHLHYALKGTEHTSNEVLTDQFKCPKELSLHEHIAFGTLRSGPRLQWMNIARGIEEGILSFRCYEVNLLHTQAAWQIGPLDDNGCREWHDEISTSEYGRLLVSQLMALLIRVKGNWLEATSVSTAVILAARLLVSSSDDAVHKDAYRFLREARSVTLGWLSDLQKKLRAAEAESVIIDYQHRVFETAAICRSTFDVDPQHVPNLLTTPNDLAILIKCCVIMYDNKPREPKDCPQSLLVFHCRDHRLSHKILPYILEVLRVDQHVISAPITDLWPAYRADSRGWAEDPDANSRWISTNTVGLLDKTSQSVHLNLLDGRLLIDGEPLGRLPPDYVQHPTYIRVFGQVALDVIPASLPGMKFAARNLVHDEYEVSFLHDMSSNDLIIQARKLGDGRIFELVPVERLHKDFPEFFLTDYHHWADLEGRALEFRPLSQPWTPDYQWLLDLTPGKVVTMRNTNDSSALIDMHNLLFRSISLQIGPLELPHYLHVTFSELLGSQIQVELPRMQLSFFINADMQLESINFRDDVIDHNQSTGTMFGLKNQLVLVAKDPISQSLTRSRSVLIPHGDVNFKQNNHHVDVAVDLGSNRHISFHRYLVDTDLGFLASDAGLTSRLYRVYLHALTSHCLPDPLTGRTGIEEALDVLSESATSSFEQIDKEQCQLLREIGTLSPNRKYHPAHPKSIQNSEWANLPSLSQHFVFSTAVAAIIQRANTLQLFYPLDFKIQDLMISSETTLLQRAVLRTHMYYPPETSSLCTELLGDSKVEDETHVGRDALDVGWVEEGHIAAWAGRLAYQNWGRSIYMQVNLVSLAESWNHLEGSYRDLDLAYTSSWLKLDLPACWITLYSLCRRASDDSNRFKLASCLSTAAFSRKLTLDLLPVVVAFMANRDFSDIAPPVHPSFCLSDGYQPTLTCIQDIVSSSARKISETPAAQLSLQDDESYDDYEQRKQTDYKQNISSYESQFIHEIIEQWPSNSLKSPNSVYNSWFAVDNCLTNAQDYFSSCARNIELRAHLQELEQILSSQPLSPGLTFVGISTPSARQPVNGTTSASQDHWSAISIGALIRHRPCPDPEEPILQSNIAVSKRTGPPTETSHLYDLFTEFEQSLQSPNRLYGKDLNESRNDLANKPMVVMPKQLPRLELLKYNYQSYQLTLQDAFHRLEDFLGPLTPIDTILSTCGVWPSITPRTLLQQLALKTRLQSCMSLEWQKAITEYAQLFVNYQQSQRLVALRQSSNAEGIWQELDSRTNEADESDPDWLLVQVEGNFCSRPIQRQVAKEMMSPVSGSNTVLQLNMGEGKSSIIVPLIAASLADKKQLVRVIVLKPLWRQTFRLLVNRLSGLANRRIYYLPFGRHIQIDNSKLQQLEKLYAECIREGGILLAQPEHILSFKLMGVDHALAGSELAPRLQNMQYWLTNHTRDILDESDEILYVRYQLVYTAGKQQPVENHPNRWTTTQQILRLVAQHICRLQGEHTKSFEYKAGSQGSFPFIRILTHCNGDDIEKLIRAIASDVLNGYVQNLNCVRLPQFARSTVYRFLTIRDFPYTEYGSLKDMLDSTMWHDLLLVRGLLTSGLLVFTLKEKHYRVDYGLDLSRSQLAVPFRAKDIPSLRAEFGHPDVAIVLTHLSYYYAGLTEAQLENCFNILYQLDNPSLEYGQWVAQNSNTPKDLQELNGVNIKDREQFRDDIIPAFSRNSAVIDFFLSSVVFPQSARQFPHKMSTSGWDLAECKAHVTTGFSGTNDNRYLLPTSITQADPIKQLSTNALVMTYLLKPENNHYVCICDGGGQGLTNKNFLKLLAQQRPEIRVLLDVGAQVLEMKNEELVRYWLDLTQDSDIDAAVYFNDKDELTALPRNGIPSTFYSSPFSQRLDRCVVYIDDGHTRGTDLKLPRNTRALVTIGPKVTKDRLLQGCMRMRKLGHDQSVMFAAPPEIDYQIRSAPPNPLGPNTPIGAVDVLRWTMLNTCKDIQHHVSHWAQQGIEFTRRVKAQRQESEDSNLSLLEEGWMTPEARNLEEMYGVLPPTPIAHNGSFTQRAFGIPAMRERLSYLGIDTLEDPSMDEEQEREVSLELEKESKVERPPKAKSAAHRMHRDVELFIQTGCIPPSSSGFLPLFHPFGQEGHSGWSPQLFASVDFTRTLADSPTDCLSDHMRPVNWVVKGPKGIRVTLSPYEVNELLPLIRKSNVVSLHIYAPRVTSSMRSLSNLDFYSIPPRPVLPRPFMPSSIQLQLDLFAGQLYLHDYQECMLLCAVLGLFTAPTGPDEFSEIETEGDGFVKPEHREELFDYHPGYAICKFTTSPIPVLKELISRRRKGMKYFSTHVGQILHARSLAQNDF